jgi:hypothetical protein
MVELKSMTEWKKPARLTKKKHERTQNMLQIKRKEGRSLAQVCELLLKGGIQEYEKEGSAYLHLILHSEPPRKPKPWGLRSFTPA